MVRKILFPQRMGEECPRPGMWTFHARFFVVLNSSGTSPRATPSSFGPLQRGQSSSAANKVKEVKSRTIIRILKGG